MLSNILREKNINVRQLSRAVRHKAHGHAFKTMLLAQCKLFYVKEFLITNYSNSHYSKAFCNAILGK